MYCSYQFLLLSLNLVGVFAISSDGYCVIAIALKHRGCYGNGNSQTVAKTY